MLSLVSLGTSPAANNTGTKTTTATPPKAQKITPDTKVVVKHEVKQEGGKSGSGAAAGDPKSAAQNGAAATPIKSEKAIMVKVKDENVEKRPDAKAT